MGRMARGAGNFICVRNGSHARGDHTVAGDASSARTCGLAVRAARVASAFERAGILRHGRDTNVIELDFTGPFFRRPSGDPLRISRTDRVGRASHTGGLYGRVRTRSDPVFNALDESAVSSSSWKHSVRVNSRTSVVCPSESAGPKTSSASANFLQGDRTYREARDALMDWLGCRGCASASLRSIERARTSSARVRATRPDGLP